MAKSDKFQLLNLIESEGFEGACRRILEARLMLYLYDIQPVTKAHKFCIDDELREKLSRIQVGELEEQGGYSDQVMTVVDTLHYTVTEETISQVVKALLGRLTDRTGLTGLVDNYYVLRVCTLLIFHLKDKINLTSIGD